jgi:small subunit ribosomal protein S6e
MVELKLVLNDTKTGKSYQRVAKEDEGKVFMGLRIGDAVKGDSFGLAGYEFVITGGSNTAGFPMRRDARGIGMRKILAVEGVGIKKAGKGIKQRKNVVGTKIDGKIAQLNLKITKEGKHPLEEKKEGAPAEEKKA